MTRAFFNMGEGYALISGHAGAGKEGKDLICAACSILSYTLERELERVGAEPEVSRDKERGYCLIKAGRHDAQTAAIMDTIRTGFRLLEENYPDHVRCSFKGGDKWRHSLHTREIMK